jgi:hypothetical protein
MLQYFFVMMKSKRRNGIKGMKGFAGRVILKRILY